MNSRTHVILKKFIVFPLLLLFFLSLLQPLSLVKADMLHYVDIHHKDIKGKLENFENMRSSGPGVAIFSSKWQFFEGNNQISQIVSFGPVDPPGYWSSYTLEIYMTSNSGVSVPVYGATNDDTAHYLGTMSSSTGLKSFNLPSSVFSFASFFYVKISKTVTSSAFSFNIGYMRIRCHDETDPVIQKLSNWPANNEYYSGCPAIGFRLQDDVGLDHWAYVIDGIPSQPISLGGGKVYTYPNWRIPFFDLTSIDWFSLTNTWHNFQILVRDTSSNERWSATWHFFKDTIAPIAPKITSSTHFNNTWSSNNNLQFDFFGSSDPVGSPGIRGYSYTFGFNPGSAPDNIVEGSSASFNGVNDGIYTLQCVAVDDTIPKALISKSTKFLIPIDTTPPSNPYPNDGVTGWSPIDNPTFSWSAVNDLSGIVGYWYAVDDSTPETGGTFTTDTTVTLSSQSDGNHAFYIKAQNGAGLLSAVGSHAFAIDVTPSFAPSPDDGITWWSTDATPTFTWASCSDNSGIDGYWYAVDDSTPETGGTFTTNTFSSLSSQSDGFHTFYVKAQNGAGLLSAVGSHAFAIDATPSFAPSPDDGITGWSTDATPTFTWVSCHDDSGIVGYWYAVDDSTPETGGIYTTDTTIVLSSQSDGSHTFYIKAQNGVGLLSDIGIHAFAIDATPSFAPSPDDGITGWSTDDTPTFTWVASSDTSGIAGYWYAVDDSTPETGGMFTTDTTVTLSSQSDSNHTFYVKAQNGAGLLSDVGIHDFAIDISAPSTPTPDDGVVGLSADSTPTFTWSSVSDTSGILGFWYAVDDSNPELSGFWTTETNITLPTQGDGDHVFYIKSMNGAGLLSDSGSHAFSLDTTGPSSSPTLITPSNDSLLNNNQTHCEWGSVVDGTFYQFQFTVTEDFGSPILNITTSETSWDHSVLIDGTFYWRVRGLDSLNNTGSWSEVFVFVTDTTFPVVTLTSFTNTIYDHRSLWLNFSINEPTQWISFSHNGNPNETILDNTYLSFTEGTHTITVYACDLAGNVGAFVTVSFEITLSSSSTSTSSDSSSSSVPTTPTSSSTSLGSLISFLIASFVIVLIRLKRRSEK